MLGELIFGFAWLVMAIPSAAKVLVGDNPQPIVGNLTSPKIESG